MFGKNLQIPGKVSWLIRGARITIGDNFYLSSGNGVNPIASNLQADVYVEPGATLTIGNNVGMSSTRLWIHESARIGTNVKIGGCVLITDTDAHPMDYVARRSSNEGTKSAPVIIEDDVWIGANVTILKGVTIGRGSVVAAGAVLTQSFPPYSIIGGVPARLLKQRFTEEQQKENDRLLYGVKDYS